ALHHQILHFGTLAWRYIRRYRNHALPTLHIEWDDGAILTGKLDEWLGLFRKSQTQYGGALQVAASILNTHNAGQFCKAGNKRIPHIHHRPTQNIIEENGNLRPVMNHFEVLI